MRWDCPTDRGYACNNDLKASNPPFFGDPHRQAPCTWQPPPVLNYAWAVNLWIVPFLLIANLYITTQYPLFGLGEDIKYATSVLHKRGVSMDPLTGDMLRLDQRYPQSQQALDHFSESETAHIRNGTLNTRLVTERWIFILLFAVGLCLQISFSLNKGQQSVLLGAYVMFVGYIVFLTMKLRALPVAQRALYQKSQYKHFEMATHITKPKLSASMASRAKAWLYSSRSNKI